MAAVNENLIHTSQTGNVSHLNNRFANKCRGNFFPSAQKKAPCSGRFQSPTPAFHPGKSANVLPQSVHRSIHHRVLRRKPRPRDHVKPRGRDLADLVARCKEGSRQRHRKFLPHFQGDGSSETGPDRPAPAARYFLGRATTPRPKYQQRRPAPEEISSPS